MFIVNRKECTVEGDGLEVYADLATLIYTILAIYGQMGCNAELVYNHLIDYAVTTAYKDFINDHVKE